MADGSTRPIEDVRVGDEVIATDPETGEAGTRVVTREIAGSGDKTLVEISIDVDGDEGDATDTIVATDGHPFWVTEPGHWADAADLRPGDTLLTPDGSRVRVIDVVAYNAIATVHNLTVDDIHTYHVVAGNTPVLVHNCGDLDDHVRASENAARSKAPRKATGGVLHIEGVGSYDLDSTSLHPDVKEDILRSGVGRMDNGDYYGSHVEVQAAFLMQKFGGEGAVGRLMITHPLGMCGFCRGNVAGLLPKGASLTVRFGRSGKFYQAGRYFGS